MDKESQFYAKKRRLSIVHKPFLKGQVNLFHPPKKNPNGHLASAKLSDAGLTLWDEDLSEKDNLPQQVDNSEDLLDLETKVSNIQAKNLFNGWKASAIFLIILGNLIATIAIYFDKQKTESVALKIEENQELITAGKSNLTAQEFVELNLNNLKNINLYKTEKTLDSQEVTQNKSPENLPLAIPPTNLPQDIIIPQAKNNAQYYYILIEYTGDRSLEIAKTKVPHVSLVNFPQGVFIYMGAFAQKEPAHKFVKHLKELGLEGYIYPFE